MSCGRRRKRGLGQGRNAAAEGEMCETSSLTLFETFLSDGAFDRYAAAFWNSCEGVCDMVVVVACTKLYYDDPCIPHGRLSALKSEQRVGKLALPQRCVD